MNILDAFPDFISEIERDSRELTPDLGKVSARATTRTDQRIQGAVLHLIFHHLDVRLSLAPGHGQSLVP
ncbi:hypothetical protein AQ490_08280 [Wenjunlia vitaminophila]|uniref:Uncharacterized protein n=1 Tax=Wenjunlia vitaminophila TaxID=76728 RepID=A0A0T6LLR0_WENVI|nr:hypothetical protein AQ490_08280 [Wenjunlia vitaminophila]